MADERRISEGDLEEEFCNACEDVFMTANKLEVYGEGVMDDPSAHVFRLYSEHISAVKIVEKLRMIGKSYFPEGTRWDECIIVNHPEEMENMLEVAIQERQKGALEINLKYNKRKAKS